MAKATTKTAKKTKTTKTAKKTTEKNKTPVAQVAPVEIVETPAAEPVVEPAVEIVETPVTPAAVSTAVEYTYNELSELWATSETEGLIKLSNLVRSEDELIVPEVSADKWEYYFNANDNFTLISSELSTTGYHKIQYKKK